MRSTGVPDGIWVSRVEASHHDPAVAYLSFDPHRSDVFTPFIFRTADYGRTWTSIVAGIPDGQTVHVSAGPDGLAINGETAAVVLTHVHYKSARRWDMAAVTAAAHAEGALALWDLSHTAGALACDLNGADADLAVGCGYKYLNGGPGCPAYAMAARRHHDTMSSPLAGWTGHARPFEMEGTYDPAPGIDRFRCGTPSMLSLLAFEAALDAFDGLSMADVRARSLSLTGLFLSLADSVLEPLGFEVVTPRADADRGSQVSLSHPGAYGVVQALIARGVIGDYRAPDVVRLGFAPLYVRHAEVVDAAP